MPRRLGARTCERLLRFVMRDRGAYEGLLGDLREEMSRPPRRGGSRRTRYNRLLVGLAAGYLVDRLRGAVERPPGAPGEPPKGRWRAASGAAEELRLAARLLRRRPGFALAVIVTMGLGFGAAAAMLSVAYAVWLRPLPFATGEDLVRVYETKLEGADGSRSRLSPPLLEELRTAEWASLSGVAAVASASYDWEREEQRQRLFGYTASRGVFEVLGLEPITGRFFSADPDTREAVLSEGLWRRAFGGATEVVGSASLLLDGDRYLIVGVVRDRLPYPSGDGELWTPLDLSAEELADGMRGARYLDVVARRRPGASLAAAGAELDAFVRGRAAEHAAHEGWGATAVPLRQDLIRPFVGILRLLLAAAALFLLIACSNVAGLIATRRVRGREERALRRALGASRSRILCRDVIEMLVLGSVAATVAVLLATWAMAPLRRLAPAGLPRIAEIRADPMVIAAAGAFLLLCAVALALLGELIERAPGAPGKGFARSIPSPRSAMTVGQVAVTTLLLLGGAAIGDHFRALAGVRPGFDPQGLAVAPVLLSERSYPDGPGRVRFFEALVEGLQRRGHAAAFGVNPPLSGSSMTFAYRGGDGAAADPEERRWAQHHVVTPEYFSLLGIPLVAGRAFDAADREGEAPVVIVNETLARARFGADPIGQELIVVSIPRRIVGVVGSVSHLGPDREPPAEMYVPLAQSAESFGHILVRPTETWTPETAGEVAAAIDPSTPMPALFPYDDYLGDWFAPLRFQLTVVALLAAAGGVLAMVGLYALIAFVVAGRRREIGIRATLGETRRSIFGRVVAHGVVLAATGVFIGTATALALRGALGSLGVAMETDNPAVPVFVAVAILAAAVAATAWPARRAARVDPLEALRES